LPIVACLALPKAIPQDLCECRCEALRLCAPLMTSCTIRTGSFRTLSLVQLNMASYRSSHLQDDGGALVTSPARRAWAVEVTARLSSQVSSQSNRYKGLRPAFA
jgi:hypothetical protein